MQFVNFTRRAAGVALAALSLASLAPLAEAAATKTYGPLDDGSMTVGPSDTPVAYVFSTRWWASNGMTGRDLLFVDSTGANGYLLLFARAFVTVPDPLPPKGGTAVVTTIYSTIGGDGRMTGFAPDSQQFVPVSQETQQGSCDKKKREYTSFFQAEVRAYELPRYLPDFDLSQFDTTSEGVYHVFKTKVPLSALMP